MKTVILGPRPDELQALIDRRHALGQDLFDEVWEGEYHMAPMARISHGLLQHRLAVVIDPLVRRRGLIATGPVNLGVKHNFRVPDAVVHTVVPTDRAYASTAALVIEILSPDDETFATFAFYAARGVEEILVVDAATRTVRCWALQGEPPREVRASAVLGVECEDLERSVDWPRPDLD